jgi:hypothetical protein
MTAVLGGAFPHAFQPESCLPRKTRVIGIKSFFSGLKRTMGSPLTSSKPSQLLAEAAFKVLAIIPHVARDTEVFQKCGRATGRPKLMPLPGPPVW